MVDHGAMTNRLVEERRVGDGEKADICNRRCYGVFGELDPMIGNLRRSQGMRATSDRGAQGSREFRAQIRSSAAGIRHLHHNHVVPRCTTSVKSSCV